MSDELKKEYTKDGDVYVLDVQGEDIPTVSALADANKKREIEAEHRKKAETREKEANDRASKLQRDLDAAQGDAEKIEEIKKEFQTQIDTLKAERKAEQEKFTQDRINGEIRKAAEKIAQNFTVPDIMVDVIAKGLGGRLVGEDVQVHVLKGGKESLETVADYTKGLLDKEEFKSIVKANAGSGGGATPPKGGVPDSKKWSEMTGTEQVTLRKSNPERANVLMKAEGFLAD